MRHILVDIRFTSLQASVVSTSLSVFYDPDLKRITVC